MSFDENAGVNKLARVLASRMKKENNLPLVLDFGTVQENGALQTHTFPVPIPKGDYSLCRHLTLGDAGSLMPGDRVLVSWVMDDAVVIDIIVHS